jgi:hypothetical protein
MWLAHCATDAQVEAYLKGKIPDMLSLIVAIEKLKGTGEVSNLCTIYKRRVTHTGVEHFDRWSDGEVLEPTNTADDICRFLDFASRFGVMAAAGLALLAQDADLWRRLLVESLALMPPRFDAAAE